MILDHLSQSGSYKHLGPRFEAAFAYLKNFSLDTKDGRHDLDGSNLYALVQSYDSAPASERLFENHRLYADIQYVVCGREIIYYSEASSLTVKTPYDGTKDATFYHHVEDCPIYLKEGYFTIFLPQDGHMPGCLWESPSPVRKVVMKIRL